ncbi:MAG: hypothetical protein Q7S92_01220 [Candidatus Diapherotrites archaeon]|nr:hypothetical protein [Candidatus Diapherotrites archaeon]
MPGPRPVRKPQPRRTGSILGMAVSAWRSAALGKRPITKPTVTVRKRLPK